MAFRRRRFRSQRGFRRRSHFETLTSVLCRAPLNLEGPTTCSDPISAATLLVSHTIPFSAAPERYLTDGLTKSLVIRGIKFSSEHLIDPANSFGDPGPENVAMIVTLWEALVKLPLAQGAGMSSPLYVPNLATPVEQGFDYADRLLWKRVTHMPFWGLNVSSGFPQLQSTIRDTDHGAQVVKSALKLTEREGLFYVRTFVHDVALDLTAGFRVDWDFWAKIYVRKGS